MAVILNEEKHGMYAREVNEMIERLMSIEWYKQAGVLDDSAVNHIHQFMNDLEVSDYELKWISKEEVQSVIPRLSFTGSEFWDVVKDLPDQYKAKIVQNGKLPLLEKTVDIVLEAVFHSVFAQAFAIFTDKKTIEFLVGHAMYVSIMACTSVLASEAQAFEPIIQLLEEGHIPLGPEGNTFYLL